MERRGTEDGLAEIRRLLSAGADPTREDENGVSALSFARDKGWEDIVRMFEEAQ